MAAAICCGVSDDDALSQCCACPANVSSMAPGHGVSIRASELCSYDWRHGIRRRRFHMIAQRLLTYVNVHLGGLCCVHVEPAEEPDEKRPRAMQ